MMKTYRFLITLLCLTVCLSGLTGCFTAADAPQSATNAPAAAVLVTDQPVIPSVETIDLFLADHLLSTVGNMISVNGYLWILGVPLHQSSGNTHYSMIGFFPDGTGLTSKSVLFPTPNPAIIYGLEENEDYLQIPLRPVDVKERDIYVHWQALQTAQTEEGPVILKCTDRLSTFVAEGHLAAGEPFHGAALSERSLRYLTTTAGTVWYESCDDTDPFARRTLAGVCAQKAACTCEIALPENTVCYSAQPLAGDRLLVQLVDIQPSGHSYTMTDGSSRFYLLDLTQKKPEFGEPLPLPEGFLAHTTPRLLNHDLGQLPAQADLYAPSGIYRWDVDAGVITLLYSAESIGFDMTAALDGAVIYEDGTLCLLWDNGSDLLPRLRLIRPTDGVQADDRRIITVGGFSPDETLRQAVDRFNRSNTEYRVKLLDYSDALAAQEGYDSGLELLQQQLIRGEGPDVVLVSTSMSTGDVLGKGLFVDLYPLIDADTELSRQDFIPGLLKACEANGTLPLMPSAFGVLSVIGSARQLGGEMGWTWDEFEAATAGYITPYYGHDRTTLLWYQLQMAGNRFIDYETGQAHLNHPDFVRLLEMFARYPEQTDSHTDIKQKIAAGEILLSVAVCSDFNHIVPNTYYYDGPIVYKGFPAAAGDVGSAFVANYRFGIRSTSENSEVAWLFVRTLLLPEIQDRIAESTGANLPVRLDSLQTMMMYKQRDEQQSYAIPSGIPFPPTEEQTEYFSRGLTKQECDDFLALIQATDTMFQFDAAVLNILGEESAAFFAGQTAAEAAASIMQNRIQTYLDEQS